MAAPAPAPAPTPTPPSVLGSGHSAAAHRHTPEAEARARCLQEEMRQALPEENTTSPFANAFCEIPTQRMRHGHGVMPSC